MDIGIILNKINLNISIKKNYYFVDAEVPDFSSLTLPESQ